MLDASGTCGIEAGDFAAYGQTNNGYTCNVCSKSSCPAGQYRQGSCSGTHNGYACAACTYRHPDGVAHVRCNSDQYRSGTCSGATNGYGCKVATVCGRGSRVTKDATAAADRACTGCPSNTYTLGNNWATCKQQPDCQGGQYLTGASNLKKGACTDCSQGRFRAVGSAADCQPWPSVCKKGQKLVGASSSSPGKCSPCEAGRYRQHAGTHVLEACLEQVRCSAGQFFAVGGGVAATATEVAGLMATAPATCEPCAAGTAYQNATQPHRIRACTAQPTCGVAERMLGNTATTRARCDPCPPETYQPSPTHYDEQCRAQTRCRAGFALVGASNASAGECRACAVGRYTHLAGDGNGTHRLPACEAHACYPGSYIAGLRTTHYEFCLTCPEGRFQDAARHQHTACRNQTTCPAGTHIEDLSGPPSRFPTTNASCVPCADGQYQNLTRHRAVACAAQPTCGPGQAYSATASRPAECAPCPAGTHQNASTHRAAECTAWPTCGSGEALRGANATAAGACVAAKPDPAAASGPSGSGDFSPDPAAGNGPSGSGDFSPDPAAGNGSSGGGGNGTSATGPATAGLPAASTPVNVGLPAGQDSTTGADTAQGPGAGVVVAVVVAVAVVLMVAGAAFHHFRRAPAQERIDVDEVKETKYANPSVETELGRDYPAAKNEETNLDVYAPMVDEKQARVQDVPLPEPDLYEAMAGPSLKLLRENIQLGETELGRGHYGVVL